MGGATSLNAKEVGVVQVTDAVSTTVRLWLCKLRIVPAHGLTLANLGRFCNGKIGWATAFQDLVEPFKEPPTWFPRKGDQGMIVKPTTRLLSLPLTKQLWQGTWKINFLFGVAISLSMGATLEGRAPEHQKASPLPPPPPPQRIQAAGSAGAELGRALRHAAALDMPGTVAAARGPERPEETCQIGCDGSNSQIQRLWVRFPRCEFISISANVQQDIARSLRRR